MPAVPITDPRFEKRERYGAFDRFWLQLIRDERDLPFVRLAFSMTVVLAPFAAFLFAAFTWWPRYGWWLGAAYLAVLLGFFMDRYILMLHNTSHRKLFKKEVGWLNHWIPWLLGPFAGETPETYYTHHIGMHHAEENLPADLSSTMRFRRDHAGHFLRYWARFFFLSIVELPGYHVRKRNPKLARRTIVGELSWYVVVGLLCLVSWQATLVVFIAPFLLVRFLMMAGNWAQHAFIDPADPANPYRNSIVCINTRYNRRCFNDGYHVGHHEMAARHWTDMPADFEKKREKYVANDSVVFEGIDYFQVWALLMLRRYDVLVRRFVDLRPVRRTDAEIEALLRARVLPIPAVRTEASPSASQPIQSR